MKLTHVFRKYGLRAVAVFVAADLVVAAFVLAGGSQLTPPKPESVEPPPVMRLADRVAAVRFAADPENLFTPRNASDTRTISTDGGVTYNVVMVQLQ